MTLEQLTAHVYALDQALRTLVMWLPQSAAPLSADQARLLLDRLTARPLLELERTDAGDAARTRRKGGRAQPRGAARSRARGGRSSPAGYSARRPRGKAKR